jgi:hypothetical protein
LALPTASAISATLGFLAATVLDQLPPKTMPPRLLVPWFTGHAAKTLAIFGIDAMNLSRTTTSSYLNAGVVQPAWEIQS